MGRKYHRGRSARRSQSLDLDLQNGPDIRTEGVSQSEKFASRSLLEGTLAPTSRFSETRGSPLHQLHPDTPAAVAPFLARVRLSVNLTSH